MVAATHTSSSKATSKATAKKPTTRHTTAKTDAATDLLMADHKAVKKLFQQFNKIKDSATPAEKQAIVQEACTQLTVHTQIEEEIFYPASRQILDEGDMLDEAVVEHASAKELIAELEAMQPTDDLYDARFIVLSEQIEHHVEEEETELFPTLRKKDKARLDEIAPQLKARKAELLSQLA